MVTRHASCHRFFLALALEAPAWAEPEVTAGAAAAEPGVAV